MVIKSHLGHPNPEPRYIHYIGQSRNFEEWYKNRKDDQGEIYKDLVEKSTFTTHTFEESTYDKYSIWKFEDNSSVATIAESKEIEEDTEEKSATMTTMKLEDEPATMNENEGKDTKAIENEVKELRTLLEQVLNKLNEKETK